MEETISSVRATLAANMVSFRAQRGWSQEELSFQSGLDRSFIAHVERKARNISLGSLEKLARAFDLPTHTLLVPRAGEQQPTPYAVAVIVQGVFTSARKTPRPVRALATAA